MGVEAIVSLKIEDGALMYGHGMSHLLVENNDKHWDFDMVESSR